MTEKELIEYYQKSYPSSDIDLFYYNSFDETMSQISNYFYEHKKLLVRQPNVVTIAFEYPIRQVQILCFAGFKNAQDVLINADVDARFVEKELLVFNRQVRLLLMEKSC